MLYRCLQQFYNNGGGDCYIVSVGDYDSKPQLNDLYAPAAAAQTKGISTLLQVEEPSLLVVPEAVLLPEADCNELQRRMLEHCGALKSWFAILDVWEGNKSRSADPGLDVIQRFRTGIGNDHLTWGAAYYPWLHTNIVGLTEIDFSNIALAFHKDLIALLLEAGAPDLRALHAALKQMKMASTPAAVQRTHQALLQASPFYSTVLQAILNQCNLLPPAAAMAGIYARTDANRGVFKAPANEAVVSAVQPAVAINDADQVDLHVPADGKAVNTIRQFSGRGVLVWGARTLAGNDNEWRYVPVRRLMIYLEQSIQKGIQHFVFEPNDANTWARLRSDVENFLLNEWRAGAFQGSKPSEAYYVRAGLGSTITAQDILDGKLIVQIGVAPVRPAEFILTSITLLMANP
ncbi:MAG: phage tail sheath family protein [Lewinellaceae bacterium]|nr:phage tail sheath family protein [Lewinellaceae bacterium]